MLIAHKESVKIGSLPDSEIVAPLTIRVDWLRTRRGNASQKDLCNLM